MPIPVGPAICTVLIDVSGAAFGATPVWTDVSADVMTTGDSGQPISIDWGRQDWLGDVSTSTCALVFDNVTGNYTPGRSGLVSNLLAPDIASPGCVSGSVAAFIPETGCTLTQDPSGKLGPNPNTLKISVPPGLVSTNQAARFPTVPGTVGAAYSLALQINNASGVSNALCAVQWLDSGGSPIGSSVLGTSVGAGVTGYSTIANTVAPTGTVTIRVVVILGGTTSAGTTTWYVGNGCLVQAPTVAEETVAAYYPKIKRGLHVRVEMTVASIVVGMFDGYCNSLETQLENGVYGITTVQASDLLGRLLNDNSLRGFLVEEMMLDNPTCLYGLQEAEGSITFGDLTGNQPPATIGNSKYGAGVVAAGQDPDGSGLLNATLVDITNSEYLDSGLPAHYPGSWLSIPSPKITGSFAIEMWVQTPTVLPPGPAQAFLLTMYSGPAPGFTSGTGGLITLSVDDTGLLLLVIEDHAGNGTDAGTPNITAYLDGNVHQIVVQFDADLRTGRLYVDGGLVGLDTTGTSLGPVLDGSQPFSLFYPVGQATSVLHPFTGGLAYFEVFPGGLTPAQVLTHYQAGANGLAGFDTTAGRLARLASYRTTTGVGAAPVSGRMGIQDIAGESLGQAYLDCGDVEGTLVYVDGLGVIQILPRTALFNPAVTLVLDCQQQQVAVDTTFRDDDQNFRNDITVSRPGGADQKFSNPVSVDQDGDFQDTVTLSIDSDANALSAAGWLVSNGSIQQLGSPAFTVDLLTEPSTAIVLAALQISPLDVVEAINLPSATSNSFAALVQGGTATIGVDQFGVAWYTTPLPPSVVEINGDAAHGINSTAILGY